MQYPLISEYIEAIRSAEDNFDKLRHLRPVLDASGNPVMSSGDFAVVFKMTDGQKNYGLKCFLREQEGRNEAYRMIAKELEYVSSSYIIHPHFYEKELFVDTDNCDETAFPVLLMDWVEGVPLAVYVKQHLAVPGQLGLLAYQFSRLAMWLWKQPFAHGDLQPDNILVDKDGNMVLVDYDGMFVPKMQGQKSRELGSTDYRHPQRTNDNFNEHIDDFSLTVLALSLKALSLDPSLAKKKTDGDGLLFAAKDFQNPSQSFLLAQLPTYFYDKELQRMYALFLLALSSQSLSAVSFRLFSLAKPALPIYKEGELIVISPGRKYIKDGEFKDNKVVKCIVIPASVTEIGEYAFSGCRSLSSIVIPEGVTEIGSGAFKGCDSLSSIIIPASVTKIGVFAFEGCGSLSSIVIPDSVKKIERATFDGCSSLSSIVIPNSVTEIECGAFNNCNAGLLIESSRYSVCNGLVLEKNVVISCLDVSSVVIPDGVTKIGNSAFRGCSSLSSIVLPDGITKIEEYAFSGCSSLSSIVIPDGVTKIGDSAFSGCSSLSSIVIPDGVTKIGDSAFSGCSSLSSIVVPNGVTSIWGGVFYGCSSLSSIVLPSSVTSISDRAFHGCSSLSRIVIPDGVAYMGVGVFNNW